MQHIIMSSCKYDNFQLYRTTPKLSGNMQWDIIVEPDGASFKVVGFHLRPLCKSTSYAPLAEENILVRPHQNNIKIFHDAIESSFYSYDSELDNDQYIYVPKGCDKDVKYNKRWDDQFWAGTQRMETSVYGYTHETLIPVWIESCKSLKICIDMIDGENLLASYELNLSEPENTDTIHEKFCKYFIDYLKYCGIYDPGSNKCMLVDLENNLTTITGIDASRGVFVTKNNYDIAKNLISRERPLLEANSILTNAFQDANMITHQLMNFNIIFNPAGWVGTEYSKLNPRSFEIHSRVYTDGNRCEQRDIFTNHQYIPRPIINPVQFPDSNPDEFIWLDYASTNALNYKQDYSCTDIMHVNKIVQPICHWTMSNSDVLFNVYDGFGAAFRENDGSYKTLDHLYDMSTDISNFEYNDEIHNDAWVAPVMIAGENYIKKSINEIETEDDLKNHRYLRSLSGNINGNIFNYIKKLPTDPDDIYLGISKTVVFISNQKNNEVACETVDIDKDDSVPNLDYVDIWIGLRENKIPSYSESISGEWDIDFSNSDIAQFHDVSGRWWNEYIQPGASVRPNYEDIDKRYLRLYVANKSIIDRNGVYKNILFVVAHTKEYIVGNNLLAIMQRSWKNDNNIKKEPKTKEISGVNFEEIDSYRFKPWCLCLPGLIRSTTLYVNYYENMLKDKGENHWPMKLLGNAKDLNMLINLMSLRDALNSINIPKTVKFTKSIASKPDNYISNKSLELKYVKKNQEVTSYVTRCFGDIKPAMFAPAIKRTADNTLKYYHNFGRNFLWMKDYSDDCQHHYTEALPKYPSLKYDSVIQGRYLKNENNYILMFDLSSLLMSMAATNDASKIELVTKYITDLYNAGVPVINIGIKSVRNALEVNQPYDSTGKRLSQYSDAPGSKDNPIKITTDSQNIPIKFNKIKNIIENINNYAKYYVGSEDENSFYYQTRWLNPDHHISITHSGITLYGWKDYTAQKKYNEAYSYICKLFDLSQLVNLGVKIFLGISTHISPTFNPDGDLIYDEAVPIYRGMTERDLYPSRHRDRYVAWPEYKWFDKSKIRLLPRTFRMKYNVYTESKQVLDDLIIQDFIRLTRQSDLDKDYIKKIYNFNYEFLKLSKGNVIKYNYLITMRLK